jgi:hypothetical protein
MNYGPHWAAKRHHAFFLQPCFSEGLFLVALMGDLRVTQGVDSRKDGLRGA